MNKLSEKTQKAMVGFIVCLCLAALLFFVLGIAQRLLNNSFLTSATERLQYLTENGVSMSKEYYIPFAQKIAANSFLLWIILTIICAIMAAFMAYLLFADKKLKQSLIQENIGQKICLPRLKKMTICLIVLSTLSVILFVIAFAQAEQSNQFFDNFRYHTNGTLDGMLQVVKDDLNADIQIAAGFCGTTLLAARMCFYADIVCIVIALFRKYSGRRAHENEQKVN